MNPQWMSWARDGLMDVGGAGLTAIRILAIIVLAWVATRVVQGLIRRLRTRIAMRMDDPEAVKRAETLGRVCRYLVAVAMSLVAGILVLSEIGISIAPILGAAGVVGLAVGFGAQSLVKDYFTGFFLLLENQIRQGDVVQLGEHGGLVEEVTLRYVRLRDYDGNVHFVPNGQIGSVINRSRGHAQAVVDIGVAYQENLDRVMAVMHDVAVD
ncbi:MAG: mechanosensitive ion channel family protein, partial [Rhodoferax sp.]